MRISTGPCMVGGYKLDTLMVMDIGMVVKLERGRGRERERERERGRERERDQRGAKEAISPHKPKPRTAA